MSDLMIHAGGFETNRAAVEAIPVPVPDASQSRWKPVPYADFLGCIARETERAGVPVRWDRARYALAREGLQLFGTAPLDLSLDDATRDLVAGDWTPQIGFRQSYDQSLAAGLVLGHRVLVCSNLAFCGEFNISAKNTLEVMQVLPERLREGAKKIVHWTRGIVGEVSLMKRIHPTAWEVSHIVTQSVTRGILPGSKVSHVLREIEAPSYDYENGDAIDGKPSLWRVFNAFTATQRDRSPATQFRTGGSLLDLVREHGLRERRAGLTEQQRRALEEMEAETAAVLSAN